MALRLMLLLALGFPVLMGPTQTARAQPESETTEAEAESGSDPEAEADPEAETDPEAEADSDSDAAPEADPDSDPETTAEPPPLVVVLSIGGDAPADRARRARGAVAGALRDDGMRILPDADVALSVSPARLRACRATSCTYEIGRSLDASMTAAVAVWDDGSLTVSLITGPERSQSATETIDGDDVEGAAQRAVDAAQAARLRAVLVEGTSRHIEEDDEPDSTGGVAIEEPVTPLNRERSLEEWILPSVLGVAGLGLVGLGVYALLDEICEVEGASGTCLRGSRPNVGLGVTSTILGTLSIAGAIIWIVVGGQPNPSMGNIDVVLGPDGGMLVGRGTF